VQIVKQLSWALATCRVPGLGAASRRFDVVGQAGATLEHPVLQRLLPACVDGQVDRVVVWSATDSPPVSPNAPPALLPLPRNRHPSGVQAACPGTRGEDRGQSDRLTFVFDEIGIEQLLEDETPQLVDGLLMVPKDDRRRR
jgi:hypothetical protein